MLRGTIDSPLTSRGPYVIRSLLPFRGRRRICRSVRTSSLRSKRFRVELATLSGVILEKVFNPQQLEPIVELDPEENSSSSRPRRVPRVLLTHDTAEEATSPLPWRMLADEATQEVRSHLPPSKSPREKRKCLSNSTSVVTDAGPKEYDILVLGPHHVTNLQLDVLQSGLGELADSIVNGFSYVLSRALSVRSRKLWVLDSLGSDTSAVKRFLKLLRLCNQCLLGVKESWSLRTVRHNRQTDDNSCGLFVLGFIRRILRNGGKIPCSITVDVDDVRSYVLETLLTQTAPESSPPTTGTVK